MSWLPTIWNRQLLLHFHLCCTPAGLNDVGFELDSSSSVSFEIISAQTQQVSGRLAGQFSTYIPVATIWKRERKRKFPLTEIMKTNLLQLQRKSRTFKIMHLHSSAGILLAKEPKVTQAPELLHISTIKCCGLVMLWFKHWFRTHSNLWKNPMDLWQSLQHLLMGAIPLNTEVRIGFVWNCTC